jgi:GTP-binding protein Era
MVHPRPVILVVTKVDAINKIKLLPVLEAYGRLFPWTEVVPVSAEDGDNIDRLLEVTVAHLPEGEGVYNEDMLTDQSMRTLAAELIARKFLRRRSRRCPIPLRSRSKSLSRRARLRGSGRRFWSSGTLRKGL